MSAAPIEEFEPTPAPSRAATRLSLVVAPTATASTVKFVLGVLLILALGLIGVMVVSTSVGAQSRELTKMRREARELSYETAALQSRVQRLSSANALALRASELGMVPNPYPAFINLGTKTVTGDPTPVTGKELPFLSIGSGLRGTGSDIAPVTADPKVIGDSAEAAAGDAEQAADAATDGPSEETLVQSGADQSVQGDR